MTHPKQTTCRGPNCRRPIVYLETPAGRKIPVDVDDKLAATDVKYVHGQHTPHHATCPDAELFRRLKRRQQ